MVNGKRFDAFTLSFVMDMLLFGALRLPIFKSMVRWMRGTRDDAGRSLRDGH